MIGYKNIVFYILCVAIFLLAGCATKTTKYEAFPQMYAEHPASIIVLPPINLTTAADAKEYYTATIAEPLTLMGYYVLPIEITNELLKNSGMYDTELLVNMPPQKFKQNFGADAVMYIKITKWNTSYYVIGGNLQVAVDCLLKSTNTGEVLWKYNGTIVLDTSGGSGNLIANIIITAIKTASAQYVPLALKANFMTMGSMPFGKYHPLYNQDGDYQIVNKNKSENPSANK
jgi:hypothetical protein